MEGRGHVGVDGDEVGMGFRADLDGELCGFLDAVEMSVFVLGLEWECRAVVRRAGMFCTLVMTCNEPEQVGGKVVLIESGWCRIELCIQGRGDGIYVWWGRP